MQRIQGPLSLPSVARQKFYSPTVALTANMPGLDYFSKTDATTFAPPITPSSETSSSGPSTSGVYYNARLDPKNYLEGPLSSNPATRLRQMLARPGIVVCEPCKNTKSECAHESFAYSRLRQVSAMASALDVPLKQASTACTRGKSILLYFLLDIFLTCDFSGAATTASRLGQPDLAIATMNDFVQVRILHFP